MTEDTKPVQDNPEPNANNTAETTVTEVAASTPTPMAEKTPETLITEYQVLPHKKYNEIEPGMTVRIYQKIKEVTAEGKEKDRVQFYEGRVISRNHGTGKTATITVYKISEGVGVEKIYPLSMPSIVKIEIKSAMKDRRKAKLYYLTDPQKKYQKKIYEVKNEKTLQ